VKHLVGVDVGGTFTDVLLLSLDGSQQALAKVPTSANPADGVVQGVRDATRRTGIDPEELELVLNGTTIATNTVIEENGARVGLLVTRGFRHVLEIARSWTPGPISGWMVWRKPAPLADLRDIREIGGRLGARGEELEPFDEEEVRTAVSELASRGIEALAISLFNGYLRPDVEEWIGSIARDEQPQLPISLASQVLPEFREYDRTLVAVANSYVQPAMRRYVDSLASLLRREFPRVNLSIVRSDGGLMSGTEAQARPIETVFSGPAGGVRAAVFLGETVGRRDVLSFDMGGTSTDVALNLDGHAAVSRRSSLTDYYKVRVPSLDVISIGAGGGSIAHVPMTGALRVGPQSAGSFPGPACYGLGGTEPTVTDANVVLGYLPSLLAGSMELRRDLAELAVGKVAEALGTSIEDAARAIVDIVNDRMLQGLKLVSVQRGHDPRTFALVAFGGAGPLHANALMELLGSPVCIVPPAPGIFSTLGFLIADVQREYASSLVRRLSALSREEVQAALVQLERQATRWLRGEGFTHAEQRLSWQFGVRYHRQGYELPVPHDDPLADADLLGTLAARFDDIHARSYQFRLDVEPELVVVRCIATGLTPHPELTSHPPATEPVDGALSDPEHAVYWEHGWRTGPIYARERLQHGHEIDGPAVVEQEDATTLIHPGARARVDTRLNLVLERF
jgi:N-methylhydantoinase A